MNMKMIYIMMVTMMMMIILKILVTNSYSDGNCVNDNAMIQMILDDFDDAIIIPVVSDAGGYIA